MQKVFTFTVLMIFSLIGGMLGTYLVSRVDAGDRVVIADSVVTQNLEIRDRNNRLTAQIAASKEGPTALFFMDGKGRARLVAGLYEDGLPFVVLNDDKQEAAGIFRLFSDQNLPFLILKHDGRDRGIFGLNGPQTNPFMIRYNSDKTVTDFGTYP